MILLSAQPPRRPAASPGPGQLPALLSQRSDFPTSTHNLHHNLHHPHPGARLLAQLKGVHDENDALKAHVSQLQAHIQAMTVKIYEVTSKYEAAVAENIRLKAELKGQGPAMVRSRVFWGGGGRRRMPWQRAGARAVAWQAPHMCAHHLQRLQRGARSPVPLQVLVRRPCWH